MKSRQAMRHLLEFYFAASGSGSPCPRRIVSEHLFSTRRLPAGTTIVESKLEPLKDQFCFSMEFRRTRKSCRTSRAVLPSRAARVRSGFAGARRTPGRFHPRAREQCGEALLHELLARGMIVADRAILAGHSMGGAIAERIAARVPVAGLIAISPAPMRAAHASRRRRCSSAIRLMLRRTPW